MNKREAAEFLLDNNYRTPEQMEELKSLMELPMRKRFTAMAACLNNMITVSDKLGLWENQYAIDEMLDHLEIHIDSIGEYDEKESQKLVEKVKEAIILIHEEMNDGVRDIDNLLNPKK